MKVEREFLTSFLNLGFAIELTNTELSRNSRLNKALWYMDHTTRLFSGEEESFQLHVGRKKIGVN